MTQAQKISRAQKAQTRRAAEQALILRAGNGTVANSNFLSSLFSQSQSGRYLSAKQMAVVKKIINERGL